jgi:hypothetical protein
VECFYILHLLRWRGIDLEEEAEGLARDAAGQLMSSREVKRVQPCLWQHTEREKIVQKL